MEKRFVEIAAETVIFDAIEKGHTNKNDLIEYMKSETFNNSVKNYADLMEKEFKAGLS